MSKGKKAKATKASEEDEQLAGLLHVLRELSKSREVLRPAYSLSHGCACEDRYTSARRGISSCTP